MFRMKAFAYEPDKFLFLLDDFTRLLESARLL